MLVTCLSNKEASEMESHQRQSTDSNCVFSLLIWNSHHGFCSVTLMHLSFWIWCCCVSHCKWRKRNFEWPERPYWDVTVEIQLESYFKPPLNVLRTWLAKFTFNVFFLLCRRSKNQSEYNHQMPRNRFGQPCLSLLFNCDLYWSGHSKAEI